MSLLTATSNAPQADADASLLMRFAEHGDRDALAELLRRHAAIALRVAAARTRSVADADDVVQEAFIQVMRHAGRYRQRHVDVRSWLLTIVINCCRMHERAARRRRLRDVQYAKTPPPGERNDLIVDVREALLELAEPYRTAIDLRYLAQLPFTEVAALLHVPEKTAQTRVGRGIERLRELLMRRRVVDVGTITAALTLCAESAPASDAIERAVNRATRSPAPPIPSAAAVTAGIFAAIVALIATIAVAVAYARPANLGDAAASDSIPDLAVNAILDQKITIRLLHDSLDEALEAVNRALPEAMSLPYTFPPVYLKNTKFGAWPTPYPWTCITIDPPGEPPVMAVRDVFDEICRQYALCWQPVHDGVVFWRRMSEAEKKEFYEVDWNNWDATDNVDPHLKYLSYVAVSDLNIARDIIATKSHIYKHHPDDFLDAEARERTPLRRPFEWAIRNDAEEATRKVAVDYESLIAQLKAATDAVVHVDSAKLTQDGEAGGDFVDSFDAELNARKPWLMALTGLLRRGDEKSWSAAFAEIARAAQNASSTSHLDAIPFDDGFAIDSAASDVLFDIMEHAPSPIVRACARRALVACRDRGIVAKLAARLTETDEEDDQIEFGCALARSRDPIANAAAMRVVRSSAAAKIRWRIAAAFGASRSDDIIEELLGIVQHEQDGDVRGGAVESLGRHIYMRDAGLIARILPACRRGLDDPHPHVRGASMVYPAESLGIESVPRLLSLLRNDPSAFVRGNAAYALYNYPSRDAALLLDALRHETDHDVRVNIVRMLPAASNDAFSMLVQIASNDSDGRVRYWACNRLHFFQNAGDEARKGIVTEVLQQASIYDSDQDVRDIAATYLENPSEELAMMNTIERADCTSSIDWDESVHAGVVDEKPIPPASVN
jgi:RNA polymerase sigma-70 factor, ECF subfamily